MVRAAVGRCGLPTAGADRAKELRIQLVGMVSVRCRRVFLHRGPRRSRAREIWSTSRRPLTPMGDRRDAHLDCFSKFRFATKNSYHGNKQTRTLMGLVRSTSKDVDSPHNERCGSTIGFSLAPSLLVARRKRLLRRESLWLRR